jgi:hypothetical protein
MIMSFKIDPRFPGKVIGTSWNGTPVLVDATPELVNAAKQTELEAASGVRLLRDNGSLGSSGVVISCQNKGLHFMPRCVADQK